MPRDVRRRRPSRLARGAQAGAESISQILAMMLQRNYGQQIVQENAKYQQQLQHENAAVQDRLAREREEDRLRSEDKLDPGQPLGTPPSMPRRIAATIGEVEKATSPETLPTIPALGATARARRIPEMGFGVTATPETDTDELPSKQYGPTTPPEFAQILSAREAKKRALPEIAAGEEVVGEGLEQQAVTRMGRRDPDTGQVEQTRTQPKGGTLGQEIEAKNLTEAGTRPEKLTTLGQEEATRRREELAAEIKKYGGLLPQQQTAAFQLADDFALQSRDFYTSQDAFRRISSLARIDSPAGDLGLIFSFMKVLDPGSTVREGEQATASNAAGIPDRIRNLYNRIMTGERLTPEQRTDFTRTAAGLYQGSISEHKDRIRDFTQRATTMQVPPQLVIREPSADLERESMSPRQLLEGR